MKMPLIWKNALGITALLLTTAVLPAGDEPAQETGPGCKGTTGAVIGSVVIRTVTPTPVTVTPKEVLVENLLDILHETESVETYVLTLQTLVKLRADGKVIVPAALRNAERLGVYRTRPGQGPSTDEMMEFLSRVIDEVLPSVRSAPTTARAGSEGLSGAITPVWYVPAQHVPAQRLPASTWRLVPVPQPGATPGR